MSDETWNEICLLVRKYGEKKVIEMIKKMNKYFEMKQ